MPTLQGQLLQPEIMSVAKTSPSNILSACISLIPFTSTTLERSFENKRTAN
jgi:hypothetical protein